MVPTRTNQVPPSEPFISNKRFQEITNDAVRAIVEAKLDQSVCVIILIHGRDPENDNQNANRWNDLVAQICNRPNPVIVLGGHEHLADHVPSKNRLTIIGAAFDESKTEGGRTLPGVGFLRLHGLGADNLKCDLIKLEKTVGDSGATIWKPAPPRRFEINSKTKHWQDISNVPCSAEY